MSKLPYEPNTADQVVVDAAQHGHSNPWTWLTALRRNHDVSKAEDLLAAAGIEDAEYPRDSRSFTHTHGQPA